MITQTYTPNEHRYSSHREEKSANSIYQIILLPLNHQEEYQRLRHDHSRQVHEEEDKALSL